MLERIFDHVNVDRVGPLPCSLGFSYLLTMVDRTTRWAEAVPMKAATTAEMVQAFIGTWVAWFGTPSDLSSDWVHSLPLSSGTPLQTA